MPRTLFVSPSREAPMITMIESCSTRLLPVLVQWQAPLLSFASYAVLLLSLFLDIDSDDYRIYAAGLRTHP